MYNNRLLRENLEHGDLKRLIHHELHVDEYKSKMGDDADVCVVSFKVSGKEPSIDLVAFIEKGYDWVLDADVSSGEKEGGDYLVFIEIERTPELPNQIIEIVTDILNLTEQKIEDWRLRYRKSLQDHDLDVEALSKLVPLTPEDYAKKYQKDEEELDLKDQEEKDRKGQEELDALKTAAGVDVTTTAPKNEYTESLRIAAGLR